MGRGIAQNGRSRPPDLGLIGEAPLGEVSTGRTTSPAIGRNLGSTHKITFYGCSAEFSY
jgi:hypothetical protein